jgi:PAS domain S-box-containing protein
MVAVATIVRVCLDPWLAGAQFITLFPAVIGTTYLSGTAAGLLAAGLSAVAAWYFVMPPAYSLALADANEINALGVFLLVALFDVFLVAAVRASLADVRDLNSVLVTTFHAHPDGVLIVDAHGTIVDCNGRMQAMFGHSRDALLGAPLDMLLPERLRGRHGRHYAGFQANASSREMGTGLALCGLRADGSEFPVDVQIGPLRLRQRTLAMATVRDVTDQRAAARALAESRQQQAMLEERALHAEALQRWANAFENIAFGIAISDAATDSVLSANPALAAMSGLTVQQVQGRSILDGFVPEERPRVAGMIETADRTSSHAFETIHQRAGAAPFPVLMHVASVRAADHTVLYRIATVQDITERRQAEEMAAALRERDRQFQEIFDESPIGLVLATADEFRFVRVNGTFARMLGRTTQELVGRQRDEFAHPDDHAMPPPQDAGTAWHPVDKRYIHADGHIVLARERVVRLGAEASRQNLVLGLAEEVTRQRQIERALHQSQRMEAVGNLAGGMAHDFNNLLAIVIGSLDSIAVERGLPADVTELVEDALGAALRGAELTRSLLAFARRQPLRPSELHPNELIRELTGLLTRLLREDVTVTLDLAADVWPVVADRAQLESALVNLASNARDAMADGGRLGICTANRLLDADYCNLHPGVRPGEYAMIEVDDSGTGMPPEVASRIFDPFFTTKSADKGTGLGLSMVFGFVQQSGGHINVYSEPGVGTVFRLYLPRAVAAAAATDGGAAAETSELRGDGVSVLVVEDNAPLRRIVTRQLQELGYAVVEADNAATALEALAKRPMDLLFTDVVMPGGMNGFELAERARAQKADLKVVLTSGYPQHRDTLSFDGVARAARLLQKPYRKQELAQVLRAALDC